MKYNQVLGLCLCLVEWELETPAVSNPPPNWEKELAEAQRFLARELVRVDPTLRRAREEKIYNTPAINHPTRPTPAATEIRRRRRFPHNVKK